MKDEFNGRNYLITGASSGIGRAVCKALATRGANVLALGRDEARLRKTLDALPPARHSLLSYDLTDVEGIAAALAPALAPYPTVHGFVHCAGISTMYPLKRLNYARLDKMMRVHFYAFIEIIKLLVSSRNSVDTPLSVVGLSSTSSRRNAASHTAYAAAKAGMDAAVRCLSAELKDKKVRINTINPAFVDTEMLAPNKELANDFEGQIKADGQFTGLIRPEDVAAMAVFLLSDAAESITGSQLPMSGGLLF